MFYSFLAVMVGISIILQNGINQQIAQNLDLVSILFFNCLISLIICSSVFLVSEFRPHWLPVLLQPSARLPVWRNGIILPGICGILIITGMPIAINKLGALRVITLVIATQIIGALIWDKAIYGTPLSTKRILSAIVTLGGAVLGLF